MTTEVPEHLLEIFSRRIKRFRRLLSGIVVLFVMSLIDGFSKLEELQVHRTERQQWLSALPENSLFRERARDYFRATNELRTKWAGELMRAAEVLPSSKELSEPIKRIPLRGKLSNIEGLAEALQDHMLVKFPKPNSSSSVSGYNLGFISYNIMFIIGPLTLAFCLFLALLQIKNVHRLLASAAQKGGVLQQRLNSLFFDRLSYEYGKGWIWHISFGSLCYFLMSIGTLLFYFSMQVFLKLPSDITVSESGAMGFLTRGEELMMHFSGGEDIYIVTLIVTSILWVLVYIAAIKMPVRRSALPVL